jgi:NadR type nicotinamide-nucleotide adenylyltransferase
MTLGFIVGKFYPPHRGHRFLIDEARKQVDHLIVLLAHHPSHRVPGPLRCQWLQEIHPDCDVRWVLDTMPDDSQTWADFTMRYLGRAPDVVFTSEDYGPIYASLMGSRHVMMDRDRCHVPISGTQIRKEPLAHLDMVESCVRAWLVRRVVLIGAESTGKTTLARKLADYYQTGWVPEYGREHWETKVADWNDIHKTPQWSRDEFEHIARVQLAREDLMARSANRVLLCDTNAFATGTWFERYFGYRDAVVDQIGQLAKADLYLLTAPDVPFVQDGFRDGEAIRDWMHDRFREQLANLTAPHCLLHGNYDQRFQQAVAAIDDLLQRFSLE